jgi:hypothetical protein
VIAGGLRVIAAVTGTTTGVGVTVGVIAIDGMTITVARRIGTVTGTAIATGIATATGTWRDAANAMVIGARPTGTMARASG